MQVNASTHRHRQANTGQPEKGSRCDRKDGRPESYGGGQASSGQEACNQESSCEMKRLILLAVVILLCGCSPQRRLARLIERFPLDTTTSIEYRDTTIYRDITITRYLPGESITNTITLDVPIDLPDTIIIVETSLARALAHLDNNELGLELIQFDSIHNGYS